MIATGNGLTSSSVDDGASWQLTVRTGETEGERGFVISHDALHLSIDWGDGTSQLIDSKGETEKIYPDTNTEYTINITGDASRLSFAGEANIVGTSPIRGVTGLVDLSYLFAGQDQLASIPSGLFDHTPKVKDFEQVFAGCSNLSSIPSGLFDHTPEVTSFRGVFLGCSNLESIPPGLFDHMPEVTDFSHTFAECNSLKSIPSGLFDYTLKVTNFNQVFHECSNLEFIPAGLFDHTPKVMDFSWMFYECSNLGGEAPELWEAFPHAFSLLCFRDCEGLSNYDQIPGKWK